jgi:hypothetical protein
MNLYQIAENHNQALMAMAEIDGLDETVINDTMDMLEGEVRDKAVSVAGFFLNIEAEIAAMKDAERNIAERRKAKEKQVAWMKNYLLENMLRTGITKIDSPYFKISLRTNPEAVHVFSEEMIPAEFITTTVTKAPNKALIKLAGGCPGVELRRGHSVVIK